MEQNLKTSKTGARPSNEAIANKVGTSKIDQVAMQSAKRAENRIHNNEERSPGNKIFSK